MDVSRFWFSGWPAVPGGTAEALAAALVSAVATLALVAGFAPRLGLGSGRGQPPADGGACDYLIQGTSVKPLSEAARALLAGLPRGGGRLAALAAHLAADAPEVQADLEALVLYGVGFRRHCPRGDGSACEIVGEPRGGAAFLSIRPASEDARALRDAEAELARAQGELRCLRAMLDRAPVLAWSHGPDGQVAWANAAYRDRFDTGGAAGQRLPDAFGHVLEEVPLTTRGGDSRRRVAVPGREEAEPRWYEVSRTTGPSGEPLGFALAADDLVAAEASLRRFVETLTETFAHLPIGLAVFDKNRRLGLFNPALTDLVKIDAVWLAGRPSLRDFLERLRETRQMPEQKDFAAWRRKLGELEEGARSGTYEENWQLPSGKMFRVTGRPHPQGALAFLFEDISTAIMLERKYRSELELSQATLDRMAEAVAVFDASGMLVFVNAAFEALWGLDPMQRLDGPGVAAMTALWAERCAPSPAWARLAEFTTAAEARTSWTEAVALRDGRRLELLVAPLPDASALVVFREPAGGRIEADGFEALALEQIRLPAEASLAKLAAAIPTVASPEAFQALSAAAQALKDGLARARALEALGPASDAGPLPGLAALLAGRGLTLAVPADAGHWGPVERRTALALGLAAADLAAPGGSVTLALAPGRRVRAAIAGAASGQAEGVGVALARRLVAAAGGGLEISDGPGGTTLVATLPGAPGMRRRA
jgi:PAS domain-containing protein